MAMLSEHTYDPSAKLPPGYRYLDPNTAAGQKALAALNVKKDSLSPPDSQFRAQIFETGPTDSPSYVVAFKGTTPTSLHDWWNNAEQATGFNSDYYDRAKVLAKDMSLYSGAPVSFTGHSLGGGLASAAAASTGQPAVTFNAAGLSSSTVAGLTPNSAPVVAYHVEEEILSFLQDSWGSEVVNAISFGHLAPAAYGTRYTLPAVAPPGTSWIGRHNRISRHGMNWVEDGIAAKRKELGCP